MSLTQLLSQYQLNVQIRVHSIKLSKAMQTMTNLALVTGLGLSSLGLSSFVQADQAAMLKSQATELDKVAAASAVSILPNTEWKKYSQGVASWMWFDVYQAALFIDKNMTSQSLTEKQLLSPDMPLKLELCYKREVTPSQFIEGANHVLSKALSSEVQAQVDALHASYELVGKGDCYALIYTPNNHLTQLKLNDKLVFSTDIKPFKSVYFGIWIGQNPLSTSLKESLLKPLS